MSRALNAIPLRFELHPPGTHPRFSNTTVSKFPFQEQTLSPSRLNCSGKVNGVVQRSARLAEGVNPVSRRCTALQLRVRKGPLRGLAEVNKIYSGRRCSVCVNLVILLRKYLDSRTPKKPRAEALDDRSCKGGFWWFLPMIGRRSAREAHRRRPGRQGHCSAGYSPVCRPVLPSAAANRQGALRWSSARSDPGRSKRPCNASCIREIGAGRRVLGTNC